jgi:hypothetical protein
MKIWSSVSKYILHDDYDNDMGIAKFNLVVIMFI